ncbi:salicylate synthase [Brucellaceae bacterium D45D]
MNVIYSDATHSRTIHKVPLSVDIITASAALAAVASDAKTKSAYIVYEKEGEAVFASGVRAELLLDRSGIVVKTAKRAWNMPLGENSVDQLQKALALLREEEGLSDSDRPLYGWAAFELSYLLQGLPIPKDAGILLYLFLPRNEVRLEVGVAELQLADIELASLWEQALRTASPMQSKDRVKVDEVSETDGYTRAAAEAIKAIQRSELRKVILSRTVVLKEEIDLVATYQTLRRNNTPARSFLLDAGGMAAAGVSPEVIIEVSHDGSIMTRPLAGTCANTGQPVIDAGLRDDLLSDPKEIYEHALSVKLAQDEIAQVSAPGQVLIEDYMHVVQRGSVQHLASHVRGQLDANATCWDAFASVFPSVTASGIPKKLACEEIHRREDSRRGLYSGAVLKVDGKGGLDAALVLRSIYQKDGVTWLRAGAGLISQSVPEREMEETREKLRSVCPHIVPRAKVTQ